MSAFQATFILLATIVSASTVLAQEGPETVFSTVSRCAADQSTAWWRVATETNRLEDGKLLLDVVVRPVSERTESNAANFFNDEQNKIAW